MNDERFLRRLLFIVHRSSFIVFLVSCATAPPPVPPPPQVTAMPPAVIDAMCMRLRDEGYPREQVIDVINTTRPLITPQSLEALAQAQFYRGRVDESALAAAAATNSTPLPIAVSPGSCSWNGISARGPHHNDTMLLELSAPFTLPFSRGGQGVLARVSLANEAATWYWIAIGSRNGIWVAGRPMPIGLHD